MFHGRSGLFWLKQYTKQFQNCFKTLVKLFCFSFISLCRRLVRYASANSAFHPFWVSKCVILHVFTWITGVETIPQTEAVCGCTSAVTSLCVCVCVCVGKGCSLGWTLAPAVTHNVAIVEFSDLWHYICRTFFFFQDTRDTVLANKNFLSTGCLPTSLLRQILKKWFWRWKSHYKADYNCHIHTYAYTNLTPIHDMYKFRYQETKKHKQQKAASTRQQQTKYYDKWCNRERKKWQLAEFLFSVNKFTYNSDQNLIISDSKYGLDFQCQHCLCICRYTTLWNVNVLKQ